LPSLATAAKHKAYSIIAAKGATSYGIASIVSAICEAIIFDQRHVRPVSHWVEKFGSCVSLPAVLGHGGVQRTIDIPLSNEEEEVLLKSVEEIKKMVRTVEDAGTVS
jgi:L-lactate dehydrogenase